MMVEAVCYICQDGEEDCPYPTYEEAPSPKRSFAAKGRGFAA